jgi:exodeoxyribonuclease-5
MMDWSPQQHDALAKIKNWLQGSSAQQVFRLFGHAGTGKTTLARAIAEMCGDGKVLFASLTGKAALVLQRKVGRPATTLHRLGYYAPDERQSPRMRALKERLAELKRALLTTDIRDHACLTNEMAVINAELGRLRKRAGTSLNFVLRQPEDCLLTDADLLVLDEVSMVGQRLGRDILSFGTPTLAIGDPGQLPAIKDGGFFTNAEPDVMLTEIHRQAKGDPIIALASVYRGGEIPCRMTRGDVSVVGAREISNEALLAADVIICGQHVTRQMLNKRVRRLLRDIGQLPAAEHPAHDNLPVVGDRVICRRNRYDRWLFNGSLWQIVDVEFAVSHGIDMAHLTVKSIDDEEAPREVAANVPVAYFLENERLLDDDVLRALRPDEFRFGYSITCHSAQGSQWQSVVVFDEGSVFGNNAARWRYTAVTRAISRLTIGVYYR